MSEQRIKAFIGGSASTGSSLLAQILNRHSKIYCGPETNLFTSHQLVSNWQSNKEKLLTNTLKVDGWHMHCGTQLGHLLETDALRQKVECSTSYSLFINELIDDALKANRKEYFIEKTPSNASHFVRLGEQFPAASMVVTVRNPLDTIASMMGRGWNVVYATGLYLYNLSLGFSSLSPVTTIKYEELLDDSEKVINDLLISIGLDFESGMLSVESGQIKMDSWNSSEDGPIRRNSSKFSELDSSTQLEILFTIHRLQFMESFKFNRIRPRFASIPELADFCGYYIPDLKSDKAYYGLKVKILSQMSYQKCMRSVRGFSHGLSDFPFKLTD